MSLTFYCDWIIQISILRSPLSILLTESSLVGPFYN